MVDYLATEGYRPEFGARELRRQIRQLIENQLAREMLNGKIVEGAKIFCELDAVSHKIAFRQLASSES